MILLLLAANISLVFTVPEEPACGVEPAAIIVQDQRPEVEIVRGIYDPEALAIIVVPVRGERIFCAGFD